MNHTADDTGVEELGGAIRAFSTVLAELRAAHAALAERSGEVHRLDKMAALGTMAGGIAHEIRNPLNAVRGFAALLAERLEEGSKEKLWSRRILEGVDECDAIVSSMLALAEPERVALETLDAREWVSEAVALCRRDMQEGNAKRWAITVDVERVSFPGDRIQLRQALRNLLANAVQAQPDGGRVRVVARAERDADGGTLVVHVTDDGPGIPPAVAERAADPFFTTRADGTGLGLALVQVIARLHGGSFVIAPAPADGGADVCLCLPLSIPTQRR